MTVASPPNLTDVQRKILAAIADVVDEVEAFAQRLEQPWPNRSVRTNHWLIMVRRSRDWRESGCLTWRDITPRIDAHQKAVQRAIRKLDEMGLVRCVRAWPDAARFSLIEPTAEGLRILETDSGD
jgi:hypothetical protein